MEIKKVLDKLYSLHQFGIKLGLDNIKAFLEHLGNPQNNFKSFHIAGSNGKGSTVSFIASMLMEKGIKTGLYTSPHFVKFNERIRVGREQISDGYIASFVEENIAFIEEHSLTFFEVTTGMAFKYFSDSGVEYGVIETGLGGRLDATNAILPLASAITTISLEHTAFLGDTIAQIAFEKAGIIKPDSKVFVGIMPPEAEEVIGRQADEKNCSKYFLKDFITVNDDYLRLKLNKKEFTIYSTPLQGRHQLFNAALAVKTFSTVMDEEDQNIISRGIANVVVNTGIQGRYEIYSENPRIIFDSAHNPEGVGIFLNEFKKVYKKYKKRSIVFTALKDKAVFEMLTMLVPYFTDFYCTTVNNERAMTIEELMKLCRELGIRSKPLAEPEKLVSGFEKRGKEECLVVLGSMYMLGQLKEKISKNA